MGNNACTVPRHNKVSKHAGQIKVRDPRVSSAAVCSSNFQARGDGKRGLYEVMPKHSLNTEGEKQPQCAQQLMPFPHELLKVPQGRVGGGKTSLPYTSRTLPSLDCLDVCPILI